MTNKQDGSTNSTVVWIDDKKQRFGNSDPDSGAFRYFLELPTAKKPLFSQERWGVGTNKEGFGGILFKEFLEIVPGGLPIMVDGKPVRKFDTLRVKYIIVNTDSKPHKVGMRMQIDTQIGNNDGARSSCPAGPV